MAALDKPHDEMLADVVAYGKAVKKLADQYTVTIFKAHALDIRRRKLYMAAVQSQNEEVAESLSRFFTPWSTICSCSSGRSPRRETTSSWRCCRRTWQRAWTRVHLVVLVEVKVCGHLSNSSHRVNK